MATIKCETVDAEPWKVPSASASRVMLKLKAKIPMIVIASRGPRSLGSDATYESPARTWPFSGATGVMRWRSLPRIAAKAMMTAT